MFDARHREQVTALARWLRAGGREGEEVEVDVSGNGIREGSMCVQELSQCLLQKQYNLVSLDISNNPIGQVRTTQGSAWVVMVGQSLG